MTKPELRKHYKSLRKAFSQEEIEQLSLDISNQLLQMPIWGLSFYHLFLSIEAFREIKTEYILNILAGKDKNTILSKSNFDSITLTNYLLTDSTKMKVNQWKIPEPIEGIEIPSDKIDVVFVPLLAYDKEGNRVGYGKGYYDNFLAECRPETLKIGLSFFKPESKITDIHENDIKLNYCVTPNTIYKFS